MMQQLRKNTLRLIMMGIVVVAATLLSTAISYGGVYLNSSYFPDANFRSYVDRFDTNDTGYLTDSELEAVTTISCYSQNISNLQGLSYFTNLKKLSCYYNDITSLPTLPSGLTYLDCDGNELTRLPALPRGLTHLDCRNNELSSLPTLPSGIEIMYCHGNQLTSLPTLPTKLETLYCHGNALTSLPGLPSKLKTLVCDGNNLRRLPALPSTLIHLDCDDNSLTSLPNLPARLETLYCLGNDLTRLPALPTSLKYLECQNNDLEGVLNVSHIPGLKNLLCQGNRLTGVKLCSSASYDHVEVQSNRIKSTSSIKGKSLSWGSGGYVFSPQSSHEHYWERQSQKNATCTASGYIRYLCGCDTVYTKPLAKKAHTYKSIIVKATTKKAGSITKKCSCGTVKSKTTIQRIGKVKLSDTKYTYNGKKKTPKLTVKNSKGKKISSKYYTVKKSKGRKYPGKYKYTIKFKGRYKGTITRSFTIKPKSVGKLKVKKTGDRSVKVTWTKSTGVDGYQIYHKTKNGKYKRIKTTGKLRLTHKKLSVEKTHYYKVRAYEKVGKKKIYSSWKTTKIFISGKPKAPKKLKVTDSYAAGRGKRVITLSWKPSKKATGYRLYIYYPNKTYKVNVKGTAVGLKVSKTSRISFRVKATNKYGSSKYSNRVYGK